MTATTEILPFANSVGANVIGQNTYAALTELLANGFSTGVAQSNQLNKVWRQSSFMAAGLANFCVSQGVSVPDDGDLSGLVTEITNALTNLIGSETIYYCSTSGSANAITLTPPKAETAYSTGIPIYVFTANASNTGSATVNISGLGAKTIKKQLTSGLANLAANDIVTGMVTALYYDGTYMQIINTALGAAATKACTDSSKSTVAMMNSGSVVSGRLAIFTDTAGTLDDGIKYPGRVLLRSTATSITTYHDSTLFINTVPVTYTLDDSSTLGNNWTVKIFAVGGIATIHTSGTDTVNGGTAGAGFTIPQGAWAELSANTSGNALYATITKKYSDNTKTTVPVMNGTVVAGRLAMFTDTIGTLDDGIKYPMRVLVVNTSTNIGATADSTFYINTAAITYTIAEASTLGVNWSTEVFALGGTATIHIDGGDRINSGATGVGITIPMGAFAKFASGGTASASVIYAVTTKNFTDNTKSTVPVMNSASVVSGRLAVFTDTAGTLDDGIKYPGRTVLVSGATSIGATNDSTIYINTAAVTYTIGDSNTLGANWSAKIFAVGGVATIHISGSDSLNGGATGAGISLPQGGFCEITCDRSANNLYAAIKTPNTSGGLGGLYGTKLGLAVKVLTDTTISVVLASGAAQDGNGNYVPINGLSQTINTGNSNGVNALDTGTLSGTAWYNVFAIAKPDGTTRAILSASASAPTLPSGYVYYEWLATVYVDVNEHFMKTWKVGSNNHFVITSGTSSNTSAYPVLARSYAGDIEAGNMTQVPISGFVPTQATEIGVIALVTPYKTITLNPNSHVSALYLPSGSGTSIGMPALGAANNCPPYATVSGTVVSSDEAGYVYTSQAVWMPLESSSYIYWASTDNSGGINNALYLYGWVD